MWSEEQLDVIHSKSHSTCVIAAPGSGKTAVLTEHIVHSIRTDNMSPQSVMAMTFTRQAAEHMRHRLLLHPSLSVREAESLQLGTFHSQMFHALLRDQADIPVILNSREQAQLMREALVRRHRASAAIDDRLVAEWLTMYSRDVGTGMAPLPREKRRIYEVYRQLKRKSRRWDYEDILLETERLLERRGRDSSFERLSYLLVDEFQDTNEPQWRIVQMLQERYDVRVFVVGDDDQAIYAFRGASPKYLREAAGQLKGTVQRLLTYNFRSRHTVVDHAQHLIQHASGRIEKPLRAFHSNVGYVQVFQVADDLSERFALIQCLTTMLATLPPTSTIGILGRTRERVASVWHEVRAYFGSQWNSFHRRVQFRTFHDSKGKEWDVVLLVDLVDPHLSEPDEVEEERRLMYVAMTRAKTVVIGFVPVRLKSHRCRQSKFLSEAALSTQRWSSRTMTDLSDWIMAEMPSEQ